VSKNNVIAVTRRILAAVEAISKSLKDNTKGTSEPHKATEEKKCETHGITASTNLPQVVETHQSKEDASDESTYRTRTLIVSGAGLILVAAYTTVAAFQWCAMRESNRISRDSLVSVQRALVTFAGQVYGAKIPDSTGKVTQLIRLNTPWINSGNTQTKDAESQVNWVAPMDVLASNFTFPDIVNVEKSQFALGPKVTGNTTMDVPVATFEDARQHRRHLYVYGWMTYRDIFSDTPPRLSEFCDEIINIKSDVPLADLKAPVTWEPSLCHTHNCYDEQCEDYSPRTKGH
jgi:hypothetical protein